jgi:Ran GTPase-activating protein (RanGAP) involved in mRNA processing and transport
MGGVFSRWPWRSSSTLTAPPRTVTPLSPLAHVVDPHHEPAPRSAAAPPSASAYATLLDGYVGCTIDEPSERGITLPQLRHTFACALERCAAEVWMSTNPLDRGKPLSRETITLYDLVSNFIVPATGGGRRSLVEVLAPGPQRPVWFVSHWWAEPVYLFIACIEQHAIDHQLGDDSAYWVCAYANRQSPAELALELPMDAPLSESPFYKALKLCVGVVSIVDLQSKAFTRAWCVFELWTALRSQIRHDIYTTINAQAATEDEEGGVEAVGLVDGFANLDLLYAGGEAKDAGYYKSYREKSFPVERAHRVLLCTVTEAEASVEADRARIMESITEPDDLDATLRARFGSAVLDRVLASDEPQAEDLLRKYGEAFASSLTLRRIVVHMESEPGEERCALLAHWLPLGLEELSLSRLHGNTIALRVREILLSAVAVLHTLELSSCQLDDASACLLGEGLRANGSLGSLDLRLNQIGDVGAAALADGLGLHNQKLAVLNLGDNQIGPSGAHALACGLARSVALRDLHLSANGLSEDGGCALGEALVANMSLTSLYASGCCLSHLGVAGLGEALCTNTSLQQLRVNSNAIGDQGARSLCFGLHRNASLTSLHVQDNEIGVGGARALADVLSLASSSLRALFLAYNHLGDGGTAVLCIGVRASVSLTELNLCHNALGNESAAALGDSLTAHTSLASLELGKNCIGDIGALALAAGLKQNLSLTTLDLNTNEIGERGATALSAVMVGRRRAVLNVCDNQLSETAKTAIVAEWESGDQQLSL